MSFPSMIRTHHYTALIGMHVMYKIVLENIPHYRTMQSTSLFSTVAHKDKTLPRFQNTFQNPKQVPEFKNTFQNPDSGMCFGFWDLFWILGSVLSL